MRELKRIIFHCSATEDGKDYTVDQIRRWHTSPPRNWRDIGYHYVIYRDGSIHQGRPIDQQGAHTRGENADSVGICYIGGVRDGKATDTMTMHQEIAWLKLVHSLRTVFGPMTIHGHNEYANKACPSFIVKEKYPFLL
ncbi:MAG: N-acetylmuramoyl-L-alanine amidase [Flavobacteriales bacterium]